MDIKKLQKLIDLHWSGSTTIEEEKTICSFYERNKNIPPELEKWRAWFIGRDGIRNIRLDDAFDHKILSYINQSLQPKRKHIHLKRIIWSSVASATILGLTYFSWMKVSEPARIAHTETSIQEQEEYEMVKELLYFTSAKMHQTEIILGENLSKIDIMNTYINIK